MAQQMQPATQQYYGGAPAQMQAVGLDQLSGYDLQYAQTKSDVKTSVPDAVKKAEQEAKKKIAGKTQSKSGK